MEKIGIFCSSSNRMDKVYYEEAARLGRWMGEHGKMLVCGGANCGLMETLAKAVREATTPSPYGQGSDVEVRRLWAEGIDDDSFDNSHACWNFFEAVN